MGYAANRGWIMPFEKARQIAPAAMEEFEEALDAYGEYDDDDESDLGGYWDSGLDAWANGDASLEINAAFNKLVVVIKELTGGLKIEAMFYNPNWGDGYDNIDWPCFWVTGVKEFTPAGRRANDIGLVRRASW